MSNDGATVWYTTMNKWPMLLWIGSLRKHIASYHSRPVISQRKINPIHCHCFIPYTGVPLCQSVLRVTLDDEGWCFGRLVSMRRIWVLCISNFQSRKPNNCWLWKYEFGKKSKSRKNFKIPFLHDGFSTNLVHKTEFLNLGFCSIFFKFWHSVSFVKDHSVLVGRHTIFQYFHKWFMFASSRESLQ